MINEISSTVPKAVDWPEPEVVLLPPEEVEEAHPEQDQENTLPSPMSVFHEERKKKHVAEQVLVSPQNQGSNNGSNPFSRFFSWVFDTFFAAEETSNEFTPEEKEKIHRFFEETKKALQAIADVVDEDDNKNFEQLLLLVQKRREAEHKANVSVQVEAIKKARKERDFAQKELTGKAEEVIAELSRKDFVQKLQHLLVPLAGMASSFQLPVKWGAALFTLSALAAANATLEQPIGEMASTLLELAIYLPLMGAAATNGAPILFVGSVLMAAQALTTAIKAKTEYTLKSYQGDLGVLNNEKRQATEKLTSIGDKAAKATEQYHKELGALSRIFEEQGELIQAMFSR